jgi:uncharacterized protein (DUF433 family)
MISSRDSSPHEHWGTVAREEADPRIVVDTGRSRFGTWVTLVLTAPWVAPYCHLRPVHVRDRSRAEEVHRDTVRWVRDLHSAVSCDPEVCHGRPVMRGTRVWVDSVFAYVDHEGRLDWHEFRRDYPSVTRAAAEAVAGLPGHVRRTLVGLCR